VIDLSLGSKIQVMQSLEVPPQHNHAIGGAVYWSKKPEYDRGTSDLWTQREEVVTVTAVEP